MKPAIALGASEAGVRLEVEQRRVVVPHGEVELDAAWPAGPTSLRGAVVAAIGPDAHVDLHNHLGEAGTRQTRACVYYRTRGRRPIVYAFGPRAADHLRAVARLGSLQLPSGDEVPVDGARLVTSATEVGLLKEAWRRYELVAPYFPSTVAYGRRPRRAGAERVAWAGQALASSIRMWLADLGLEVAPSRPVHVQVADYDDREVRWRGRDEAVRIGFVARFVANVRLPPGIGLGQHVSEAFGEVRPWG